jgi:hypothetical protein
MSPLDWWQLWRLRRRHPEWTILPLRHGFRAYRMRPDHDVHAGTLQSLARHMTDLAAPGKPGVPS